VQWLRDGLQFFSSASEIEALALTVPDSGGVIVVPAFAGLGAPHWRPDARGSREDGAPLLVVEVGRDDGAGAFVSATDDAV
jgi:hypothetical protein